MKVFRQPPDRLNCAQAILHAWHEVMGETGLKVADLKPFGGGRAPGGLCGSLQAVCLVAPDRADAIKAAFAARIGSLYCREVRAAKKFTCAECVAEAAELLEGKK